MVGGTPLGSVLRHRFRLFLGSRHRRRRRHPLRD